MKRSAQGVFDYYDWKAKREKSLQMLVDDWYEDMDFDLAVKLDREIDRFREAGREFLLTGSDDAIYEGLALPR